jgi:hypothetical protein
MRKEKNLVIVFVKNILLGKVKTRLAKTIGDQAAFEVYKHLVAITEAETQKIDNCDIHIYFSDAIIETKWLGKEKFVQSGANLGERMKNAFQHGFKLGYQSIIGVGSDLPDLNSSIIKKGFEALKSSEFVFGPAKDGGYYIIGMNNLHHFIFENKPWSQSNLLEETISEIKSNNLEALLLEELNDVDTIEDLKTSTISELFSEYTEQK